MNPPKLPKCVEGLGSGGLASTGKREKKKVRKILDTTVKEKIKINNNKRVL